MRNSLFSAVAVASQVVPSDSTPCWNTIGRSCAASGNAKAASRIASAGEMRAAGAANFIVLGLIGPPA